MMWTYLAQKVTSKPEDPDEIELAYLIQNSSGEDPSLHKRLIIQLAGAIYQWVAILLFYKIKADPTHEQVLEVLGEVFKYASRHTEQFHGNKSVRDWVFSIALKVVNDWKIRSKKNEEHQKNNDDNENDNSNQVKSISGIWADLDKLEKKQRNAVILRYLFDLSLTDIAQVYNRNLMEIHHWLKSGRSNLSNNPSSPHLEEEIQRYFDGMLDEDANELDKLNQHLLGCQVCQTCYKNLEILEKDLVKALETRWRYPTLSEREMEALINSVIEKSNLPQIGGNQKLSLRQLSWLIGLSLMIAGVLFVSIKLIPIDNRLSKPLPTVGPGLPPVVQVSPLQPVPAAIQVSEAPLYIAPSFSSDGQWAAFTASAYNETTHTIKDRTVYLYNHDTATMKVINYSTDVSNTWVWWDLAPSISADGRWIVYVSSTNDKTITGDACTTSDGSSCLDILLYDRETGQTKRLSKALGGGPANGDSLAPTISGDGKWVAFWSTANNLIGESTNTCQSFEFPQACLNIYLYNLESGAVEWIPIQSIPGDSVYGVDRISLSTDGRYIGFTAAFNAQSGITVEGGSPVTNFQPKSTPGSQPNFPIIAHSNEAIVFDRMTSTYELVNQTQDGTAGNGDSSSPILSGDGRYVVFFSTSTNLVPGQTINNSEVYLRDRNTGQVELISLSSNGEPAKDNSGLTFMERGYYSLDISADGQFVVFESTASNLGGAKSSGCEGFSSEGCIYLYVRDRQANTTEAVSALPAQDFTLFPNISTDGRWIDFMQYFHDCSTTQLRCSNVMLYDRQNGWTANLTKFGQQAPNLAWKYSGTLNLPWQSWESVAMAESPDGKLIAVGGNDDAVRIWQSNQLTHDGTRNDPAYIFTLNGNDYFSSMTFNSNGAWLAAGTSSGALYVWDIMDRRLLYHINDLTNPIKSLVFTQDGSQIAIATTHEVWMWSLDSNQLKEVNSYSYGLPDAYAIAISPMANIVASARYDGTIWIQSLPDGVVINRFSTGLLSVRNLVFSHDGSLLASRLADGSVSIWQISCTTCKVTSISLHSQFQTYSSTGEIYFTHDQEYLVQTGVVGELPIWSTKDGALHYIYGALPNEMVFSVAFTNDGSQMAVAFESQVATWAISNQNSPAFFSNASSDQFIDSSPFISGTVNDLAAPQNMLSNIQSIYYSIDDTAANLKFQLLVPAHIPNNFTFLNSIINRDGSVWLKYVATDSMGMPVSLYIYEQELKGESAPTMIVGSNGNIVQTQFQSVGGPINAELVQGDWLMQQTYTVSQSGSLVGNTHPVWYWDGDSTAVHLRWQQDGLLMGLYYQPNWPYLLLSETNQRDFGRIPGRPLLGESDLVQIASGIEIYQPLPAKPEYIPILRSGFFR